MRIAAVFSALGILAVMAAPADAQRLRGRCASVGVGNEEQCARAAESAETALARLGIALAGGNPVQGTASTFGMRIGSLPRIGATFRFTGARIETARFGATGVTGSETSTIPSLDFDVNVGLFSGFAPWATVGGLASIDLLGSLGGAWMPDPFDGSPFGLALGARVGILRESFTAPGISISAMYRRPGDFSFQQGLVDYTVDDIGMWSLRGTIGKRIALFGVTGGVGYDILSADAVLDLDGTTAGSIDADGFDAKRWTAFVNVGYTFLIATIAGEMGWQQGGDSAGGGAAADAFGSGALYASIALRIAI